MSTSIIAAHNPTARIARPKRKLLARESIPIDVGNSVVERRRSVREAPDQLRGRRGEVLVVLGQTETVALSADGLAVFPAAAGQGLRCALLVGTRYCQEDLLRAVVLDGCCAGCEGGGGDG